MSKILPNEYFAAQERLGEWFEDLKRALGCSENADHGAVLRKAKARERKIESYEKEQLIVARHYNYESWGYIVRAAMNGSEEEAIAIEIPKECLEVPRDWCYGEGKPDYKKAKKQLPTAQTLLRKCLAFIEERRPEEGDEWADGTRENLIKAFVESGSPSEIEREIWQFINGVDEEGNPSETWVPIAAEAASVLEKDMYLPTTAVEQLLVYAEDVGVEVTECDLAFVKESERPAKQFFNHLLTAFLCKESRVSTKDVENTIPLVERALSYWGCYDPVNNPGGCFTEESANDPLRPTMMRRTYMPDISVEQIDAACRMVYKLEEEAKEGLATTHNEIAKAVRESVKQPEAGKSLTTAEKTN